MLPIGYLLAMAAAEWGLGAAVGAHVVSGLQLRPVVFRAQVDHLVLLVVPLHVRQDVLSIRIPTTHNRMLLTRLKSFLKNVLCNGGPGALMRARGL